MSSITVETTEDGKLMAVNFGDTRIVREDKGDNLLSWRDFCSDVTSALAAAVPRVRYVPAGVPQFEHDCETCVFLGRFNECDLYIHPETHITVIARWDSDGPKYASSLVFIGVVPELTEAARRAVDRGLLDPETKTGRMGGSTVGDALEVADFEAITRRAF